jgi:hypothetical protein
MTYETSKFGNGVAVGSGGNVNGTVHARFGTQKLGEQVGVNHSKDAVTQITMTITGEQLVRDAATNDGFLLAPTLPVGAVITKAVAQVKEVFVLGGTTPTINIGTSGSEATNGVPISEAQAEAVGTYNLTPAGTWANPIATAVTLGVALGGTSPTVTAAGRVDIIIEYIKA